MRGQSRPVSVGGSSMRRWLGFTFVALALAAASGHAQEGGDLQAQILYAYQTEDANQLSDLEQNLSNQVKSGDSSPALRYHLAHADYRLGLLTEARRGRDAPAAFSDCIEELKPLLDKDAQAVEVLILQSVCYGELAKHKRVEAVLLRARAEERLNAAFKLDPHNPRVLYFMATEGLERAKPGSAERERAFAQLRQAAQAFDQTSATRNDVPGWGHAEAYLALGVELRRRGDLLGARNWIEKSLIVAPDYKAAQRELAALVRR